MFYTCITWPSSFLLHTTDGRGHSYSCKTTTLEIIALILPFLTIPNQLAGRNFILQVDNTACVYGWQHRHVSHEASDSIFIRALHLTSAYLACYLHVVQVPRKSTPAAVLADGLS